MLRRGETENIPLLSARVPVIIVSKEGEVEAGNSKSEKEALLSKAFRKDWQGYAVWPGEWRSDVFELDVKEAMLRMGRL